MKVFILATIVTLFRLSQSGIISETSVDSDYKLYTAEIRVIFNLLAKECRDWGKQEQVVGRRDIITAHHVEVRKKLHDELMNELIKCRERNSLGFTQKVTKSTKKLPAETQPTATTIPPMTTTLPPTSITIPPTTTTRSEEHTSELQSPDHLVCRLLLEKKKKTQKT